MTQDEALDILKTGSNVFLTGEPGSGKTHTVNRYVHWLRERGIDPAITASTGIAATHIGGYTIHSWSGIGIKTELTKDDFDRLRQNRRAARCVRAARVLIIDEISMLSAATLAAVDVTCRALRERQQPFGGMQVVLVGDFFQLPPVVRREAPDTSMLSLLPQDDERGRFAYLSSSWYALKPTVCYLSEQHRQEDAAFLDILSAIRRGSVSADHRALLWSRRCSMAPAQDEANAGAKNVTQLYSHNIDVDRVNAVALQKLPGQTREFVMQRIGPDALTTQLVRGCLSPETLTLKEGARVMFTKNNFTAGFVNGTTGTVVGFADDGERWPIVEVRDGRRIIAEPMEWAIEGNGAVLGRLVQIPLRLAWAITVHKSQGMSLDAAHIDLAGAFEYGQGYVALSRVRTLSGLTLAGLNERALAVHPDMAECDAKFRRQSDVARASLSDRALFEKMQAKFIIACGGKEPQENGVAKAKVIGDAGAPVDSSIKVYSVDAIRQQYPNAYRPWSEDDDVAVTRRFKAGEKTEATAHALGRQPGSIRSRLVKLGLLE
ncbi:MAG: AAA family ATPase [Gammaproteobacteria bacterium]|nr:AAA family ATPase [Gammaproteobacteria bacterium]